MVATVSQLSLNQAIGDFEVSVVMPCLNEARTVGICVEKAVKTLEKLGVRGEVVIADNGSTDGSPAIAEEHGARVVHVTQKGYGSALQAGIASARGRFVVMGDADDSYDFTQLAPFLEKLRGGDELVMGNRFRGGIMPGAMPWHHRYIGNPVLTGILNLFFHTPIRDAHCGLRAFRKDSYEQLQLTTTGMEFASEMVVKACLHGQKISEVPTTLKPDGRDRPPHLRSFRDGWRHLRFLLLYCPLWLYMIPALSLILGGLGLMTWLTAGPRQVSGVVFDVHSMLLGSMCVLVGYQVLWLWAFAKIHGWTSGMLPVRNFTPKHFQILNLERGLILGFLLFGSGLIVNAVLLSDWLRQGMGPLDVQVTLRWALWGFTLLVLGVQTIFGSFLLSMMGMTPKAKAILRQASSL